MVLIAGNWKNRNCFFVSIKTIDLMEGKILEIGQWHSHNSRNTHLTVTLSSYSREGQLVMLDLLATCIPRVDIEHSVGFESISLKNTTFQAQELTLQTHTVNRATSLLASNVFPQISHLTVQLRTGESCTTPAECLVDFVRHCRRLKKVTVKCCENLPADFQKQFFAFPAVSLRSRSIRFQILY